MATQGTPKGGRNEIAERSYVSGADYTLVCYRNLANSLNDDSVVADLVQPTVANGYAPIVLNGTWSVTNGVASYVHSVNPVNPTWFASGAWDSAVNGVAMIYGARIMHFKDIPGGFTAAAGKKLAVAISDLVSP